MSEIIKWEHILRGFTKIGLHEFGDDRFAERKDRKFPVSIYDIPKVLPGLEKHYSLICPEGNEVSTIETKYFDTENFDFFRQHHRGRSVRRKVRIRRYVETDTSFLEIKRKNVKGRTLKHRISVVSAKPVLDDRGNQFLKSRGVSETDTIHPVLKVVYDRLSFLSEDQDERFSVDFNVRFSDGQRKGDFGKLAIFEVKQSKIETTPVIKALRKNRISERSISKYCLSLCQVNSELKANRFKPVLRNLQALIHEKKSQSETLA